jgi:DNA-binding response OmpR family regulator
MAVCCALVVEDEPANQDFLVRLITQAGFDVSGAHNGESALRIARELPNLQLVATDLELPDISGLDLVTQLRAFVPDALILVASMWDEPKMIATAFANGADVFLVKPHGFMELYKRLKGWPDSRTMLTRLLIDQYGPRPYTGD